MCSISFWFRTIIVALLFLGIAVPLALLTVGLALLTLGLDRGCRFLVDTILFVLPEHPSFLPFVESLTKSKMP